MRFLFKKNKKRIKRNNLLIYTNFDLNYSYYLLTTKVLVSALSE